MSLSTNQRRKLRALAHHLNPVVTIGNQGLSAGVLREIDLGLEHHELIKIRAPGGARDKRRALFEDIERQAGAELVQDIGHIGVFYRAADPPRIVLGS